MANPAIPPFKSPSNVVALSNHPATPSLIAASPSTAAGVGKSARLHNEDGCSISEVLGTVGSLIVFILTWPIAIFYCIKVVREYERAVIFRMGKIRRGGAAGPGPFFILPCMDEYRCLDLRIITYDVPVQEILTKDSVSVAVDAVIFYRVFNPVIAVANVSNWNQSTQLLAATVLRNVLGTKTLTDILVERESISEMMRAGLDEATDPWGVKVERVEVKDVRLPIQLQRAMAAEAEAARDARAKVIAADGEKMASKALKDASDMMITSPGALQLRYLQTLATIATDKNHTVIFPMPLETLRNFSR